MKLTNTTIRFFDDDAKRTIARRIYGTTARITQAFAMSAAGVTVEYGWDKNGRKTATVNGQKRKIREAQAEEKRFQDIRVNLNTGEIERETAPTAPLASTTRSKQH